MIDSAGDAYGTATGKFGGITGTFAAEWIPANSTGPIIVGAGQTYHIANNSNGAVANRSIGGVTINTGGSVVVLPVANSSTRQVLVITGGGLSIAGSTGNWTGSLDVGNSDLDLPGASLATVTNQIKQGYNNGAWNGSGGITSMSAAADSRHLTALGVIQNNQSGRTLFGVSQTFDGVAPGAGDVLVKYTYYGDANLDGIVNSADYTNIDYGYLSKLSGWMNGDFNYDGVINGSDYTLIDNAFNSQSASLSSQVANSTAQVGTADSVPEPSWIGWVLIALGMLWYRPRAAYH